MAKHKVHRGASAYKHDIILLTCILRLRIQPSVPYPLISDISVEALPDLVTRLCKHENISDDKLSEWMEVNFMLEEEQKGKQWLRAKEGNGVVLRDTMQILGLGEKGYVLADDKEIELQIKWRREGDWRAGSFPEETRLGFCNAEKSTRSSDESAPLFESESASKSGEICTEISPKTKVLSTNNKRYLAKSNLKSWSGCPATK